MHQNVKNLIVMQMVDVACLQYNMTVMHLTN